ncbi:M23 family metallopeptidase [Aliidiomarina sanyensis]|nr:M23 family metallopeptidase [Aliidiomarina sanyensis]
MPEPMQPSHTSDIPRWRKELGAWYWPMLLSLACVILLQVVVRQLWGWNFPFWLVIALYLILAGILSFGLKAYAEGPKKTKRMPHPASQWPVAGPLRYLGRYAIMFTFIPTSLLSIFNPWQLTQQLKQIGGQARVHKRMRDHYEALEHYQNKVSYRLPFDGEWLIFNGGLHRETSHSWDVLAQRYAYDFVKADASFRRHSGAGNRLKHYFCYEEPILAAASGEVVHVQDGIGPAPLVGFGVCDFLARHFAGNHVVIRHAEGEYGVYAHLIKGTIPVQIGDRVAQGDRIGLCGHTGHSSEPHLHFHLQDGESIFSSMGLPIRFETARVNGTVTDTPVEITRGQRVAHIP